MHFQKWSPHLVLYAVHLGLELHVLALCLRAKIGGIRKDRDNIFSDRAKCIRGVRGGETVGCGYVALKRLSEAGRGNGVVNAVLCFVCMKV